MVENTKEVVKSIMEIRKETLRQVEAVEAAFGSLCEGCSGAKIDKIKAKFAKILESAYTESSRERVRALGRAAAAARSAGEMLS